MRRTLRAVLEFEDDLTVLADVADLGSLERTLRERRPRVVAVDLALFGGWGVEAVAASWQRMYDVRIVALSSEAIPALAERLVCVGARGFVLKEHAAHELPEAVRAAARGETYISPYMPICASAVSLALVSGRSTDAA
jgi:DNA-binding NarL/FixJ family response regulator